jgi:hypothetical protein
VQALSAGAGTGPKGVPDGMHIALTSSTTAVPARCLTLRISCTVLRLVRCRSVWRQCDQCSMTFTAVGTGLLSGQSGACLILGLAVFADKATICVL